MWLHFRGAHPLYYGPPENGVILCAMEGIFGLVTSFGILGFWYYFSKRLVSIAAVAVAIMLEQSLKIILEGFLPPLYILLGGLTYSKQYCRLYPWRYLPPILQGRSQ
jgi:hypothetical protein